MPLQLMLARFDRHSVLVELRVDIPVNIFELLGFETKRIYDGVEAETRKSQASFQIIQVSFEALPRMRLE